MLKSLKSALIRPSKDQLKEIVSQAGCTDSEAKKLYKVTAAKNLPFDFCVENNLYRLPLGQLEEYAGKKAIQQYVNTVAKNNHITAYDAYTEMYRARGEFGVPFSMFVEKGLYGVRDARLKAVGDKVKAGPNLRIEKIVKYTGWTEEHARSEIERVHKKFGIKPDRYYMESIYALTDDEIEELVRSRKEKKRNTLKEVCEATGWSPAKAKSHMRECQRLYGFSPTFYCMSKCWDFTEEELENWGSQRDSKNLSRMYNISKSVHILNNKAVFDKAYKRLLGRKVWVNEDTSLDEFLEFADGLDYAFFKPVNASHGTGARKIELKGANLEELYNELMAEPTAVIEEFIVQHPDMSEFYDGCVNSVRVFSIQKDDVVDTFMAYVRFGVDGVVDNFTASGVACGVDPKTGVVVTKGSVEKGDLYDVHPVSKKKFEGFQIPHWDKVLELAEAATREVDDINYAGWDIAIRENDVVLIEGNSGPGISSCQSLFAYQRKGLRPTYRKYLETDKYPHFEEKAAEVVERIGCKPKIARRRLIAAYKGGLSYEDVLSNELYRMTVGEIELYTSNDQLREVSNRLAEKEGVSVYDAFAKLRHAKKGYGIAYDVFEDNSLFDADDAKLEEFSQAAKA